MIRTMKNVAVFITALALVAGMVSCENWMIEKLLERNEPADGGGSGGGGGSNVAVERVEITNGTARGGGVGSALVIRTEVYPANATNREVEWTSSNSGIADVVGTANGATVHLLEEGNTEIRVKTVDGGKEAVCTIKVVSADSVVAVTEVKLNISTLSLQVGEHPVTLIATVLPANATDHGVVWSSSNDGVVHVENGMLWALKAGPDPATITAKSTSNSTAEEGTCTVTVNAVTVDKYKYMPGGTVASGNLWAAASTGSGDKSGDTAGTDIPVGSFVIGKTEVRYELWYIVRKWGEGYGYTFANKGQMGKSGTPGAFPVSPGKDEPVTAVSWRDVVVWCNAFSQLMGREAVYYDSTGTNVLKNAKDTSAVDGATQQDKNGYRLPTEAEWEYAARGGVPAGGEPWTYTYAGGNGVGDVAWYSSNSGSTTHPVKGKTENDAGLYDMSGNVWEWCFDKFDGGARRVVRGGSWADGATGCLVAARGDYGPDYMSYILGWRLVCR